MTTTAMNMLTKERISRVYLAQRTKLHNDPVLRRMMQKRIEQIRYHITTFNKEPWVANIKKMYGIKSDIDTIALDMTYEHLRNYKLAKNINLEAAN